MQAESYESASVRLSTEHKGRKRRVPVWVGRYRLAGKGSAKVLGKAWTKRSRPPAGYLTRADAEARLRRFLEREGAKLSAAGGVKFGVIIAAYLVALEARIEAGDFRASTLRSYRNIIIRDLRPGWRCSADRRDHTRRGRAVPISARQARPGGQGDESASRDHQGPVRAGGPQLRSRTIAGRWL